LATLTHEQLCVVFGALGQFSAKRGLEHAPGAGALAEPFTVMLPPMNELDPNAVVEQNAAIAKAAAIFIFRMVFSAGN